MLYMYFCFYLMTWKPLRWVYVSDIFPTKIWHYGLAHQCFSVVVEWVFSVTYLSTLSTNQVTDFRRGQTIPVMVNNLGWNIFVPRRHRLYPHHPSMVPS